jgi:hypothetical protein
MLDEIMADRGFTIDDLLFPLRVKLNIPAFTKSKPQLSAEDVTLTTGTTTESLGYEHYLSMWEYSN